jgi:hypothetical protein
MNDILHLFIQNGLPMDMKHLGKYLRDMEVGGLERLLEQFSADDQQINYEHSQFVLGKPLPINEFDDDDAHIQGHQEFQKGSKYRQLDPQIQMLIEQHVQEHKNRVQQKQQEQMQQQMMQQQMAQGGPPPSQQPPQQ